MGSVIPLKNSANSAYLDLRNLVANKLDKVEKLINLKLESKVDLIQKMTKHHLNSGGKRLRALLTLGSAKLAGYDLGDRDINLASCVELIHSATLLHDDVIDESDLRRGSERLIDAQGGGTWLMHTVYFKGANEMAPTCNCC